ncbi:ATP-binding protein [Eubacterium sp. AB3007]|uniref:ATP-binding protein n=1 Tax=Eubacterium sp. AB3007 TaxID=1392487 RepID=UPI00048584F3|nr:ATP-binding protein [Eubacterium sp. AB3007]
MNELQSIQDGEIKAKEFSIENYLQVTEEVIRKQYLSRLKELQVADPAELFDLPPLEEDLVDNIRLFKISEMVYQKGEPITEKFTTVFNTLSTYKASLFILIDSDGEKVDFYIGVRNGELIDRYKRSTVTLGDTLKNTLVGNFPGIKLENVDRSRIEVLSNAINQKKNVASVSVVADRKIEQTQGNDQFVQGLEKLALAMQGRAFTGIIIAENQTQQTVARIRKNYQTQYTLLSPYQKVQTSKSLTDGKSRTNSFVEMDGKQKAAMIAGAFAAIAGTVVGAVAEGATGAMIGGSIAGHLSGFLNSLAPNEQLNHSMSISESSTVENKEVTDVLQMLDDAIQRTKEFDSYGMWNVAGYFVSDDMSAAEIAASNYRSLMNGENSGREVSAINSWRKDDTEVEEEDYNNLALSLSRFIHPQFYYGVDVDDALTDASTWISGKELGIHMGLPRSSVSGFPVIRHAEFGKEVTSYNLRSQKKELGPEERITLGKVFDLGKETGKAVELENKSLNMHTFITGSTGSGKSNTVYQMLNELYQDRISFLVIEPAKGEYKDVFGNLPDVNVFSTNPKVAQLIHLNPFRFPDSIHVLEHVDGLVEIFSVCWPMYDAMPAFFKDAILRSYEAVGWDLGTSTFDGTEHEYPDFELLAEKLDELISASDYASDIKSNYRGALITRVRSLTVGLNKYMFTSDQTPYTVLFDQNCILDISRVKSTETKALLMGLMVYILNEYRVDQRKGSNRGLEHVTVLEEAHNLLKNTSGRESELIGKSVEMLTQTIAEIRTYGEGFVIVDQSPSSVDIAAIKNTNTKIVLRTPEANDREAIGRSMGLTEDQVNEIAKLPSGVAVVYQNNWVSPVLTIIDKANVQEHVYVNEHPEIIKTLKQARSEVICALMQPWIDRERLRRVDLLSSLKVLDLQAVQRNRIAGFIDDYVFLGGKLFWELKDIPKLQDCLKAVLCVTDSQFDSLLLEQNPDSLRTLVISRTEGFNMEEIDEICNVLTKAVEE